MELQEIFPHLGNYSFNCVEVQGVAVHKSVQKIDVPKVLWSSPPFTSSGCLSSFLGGTLLFTLIREHLRMLSGLLLLVLHEILIVLLQQVDGDPPIASGTSSRKHYKFFRSHCNLFRGLLSNGDSKFYVPS